MSEHNHLSRRAFLRWSALAGTGVLAACAPKVVKETVVVEKQVTGRRKAGQSRRSGHPGGRESKGDPRSGQGSGRQDRRGTAPQARTSWAAPTSPRAGRPPCPICPRASPTKIPVVITCTRRVDAQTTFCTGDDLENNPWSRMIEALFNVKY